MLHKCWNSQQIIKYDDCIKYNLKIWFKISELLELPDIPPTHWQSIGDTPYQESTVKGYDEKYNLEEDEDFEAKEAQDEEERQKIESERGMSPTMSLVIGIIIGSFTAMILIVIIVLKVRTGVDIAEYKQVRTKHHIFSALFLAKTINSTETFHRTKPSAILLNLYRRKCSAINFHRLLLPRGKSLATQTPQALP